MLDFRPLTFIWIYFYCTGAGWRCASWKGRFYWIHCISPDVHKILEGTGGIMTDRGELKDSDADLSRCLYIHHNCHVTANSGLACDQPATNRSSYGTDRRPNWTRIGQERQVFDTHTLLRLSREKTFVSINFLMQIIPWNKVSLKKLVAAHIVEIKFISS